jgi:hypothetical protein
MKIALLIGGFQYLVSPNIQGFNDGHYELLGLRLYDEEENYYGYWLWDYIPDVIRETIEKEVAKQLDAAAGERKQQLDTLNGFIHKNSRLP